MNLDNFSRDGDRERTVNMYASMPLIDYIDVWMEIFKEDTVKPATLRRLNTSASLLRKNDICQKPIRDITALDIQRYVNILADEGYALTTIKKQFQLVTAPLKQAAAMHFISADPSAGVKLPREDRLKKRTKTIEPYTPEEQDRLWEVIDTRTHPAIQAIGLMLETGLRAGELLALRWDKVDLGRKRLQVDATIIDPMSCAQSSYQTSPKSKASNRMIPLTPRAIEVLRRLEGLNDTWVFPGPGGEWLTYGNLMKHVKQACKNAHVPYRGAHAFRHTFATNCYYKNMDVKILSKLLGHSDVAVTMNIYVSLRGDGFDEMYKALLG